MSVLIEQISELPILHKLADKYAEASEEYIPSGPPNKQFRQRDPKFSQQKENHKFFSKVIARY